MPSSAIPAGAVVPVAVDGDEFVVWRGRTGVLGSSPRACPHLDWDLSEATVVGDELLCPGHGWSLDCNGHAFKRNELGRIDPKDDIATLQVSEGNGAIVLTR